MNLPGYDVWKLASPDEDNEEPDIEEIPDAPEPDLGWEDYEPPTQDDEENLWGV
ncbi:hypothetical protein UFOVP1017_16 [uncultured Caudovirales phage]|uniref:Uncharacterized protein n=1 Tax=uncultured Caudovirales phage TaxID=2100421 RepID=A0A6J5SY31_9CAUD|nr:hypothetical protein UFOVP511_16 [uncultured Caudovirales phage]CAB4178498.1 hypothetical protein UFOVP1017_16 [uncultured Caudovirales phage]CAB4187852.1 hypothetical protein UFOVP1168_16 [uncultured Caudovirales phage]CAB4219604.1 hypothetical protein UFOVP1617_37 [uncultured Caudovirales phage]